MQVLIESLEVFMDSLEFLFISPIKNKRYLLCCFFYMRLYPISPFFFFSPLPHIKLLNTNFHFIFSSITYLLFLSPPIPFIVRQPIEGDPFFRAISCSVPISSSFPSFSAAARRWRLKFYSPLGNFRHVYQAGRAANYLRCKFRCQAEK